MQIQASSGNSHTLEMHGEARLHIIRGAKDAWRLCSLPELAKPSDTLMDIGLSSMRAEKSVPGASGELAFFVVVVVAWNSLSPWIWIS